MNHKISLDVIIKWSPAINCIIVIIGTVLSFSIALNNGKVNAYLPFISETGAFPPQQGILSFTLYIASFIGSIFITYKYLITDDPSQDTVLYGRINKLALGIGLSSMICLAGVAAFPVNTVYSAHLLAAGSYFATSTAYIILCTIITKLNGPNKMYKLRLTLSVIVSSLQLILIFVFPIAMVRWNQYNDGLPALKTPENYGFTLLIIAAFLEWSSVTLIYVYLLTFIIDFQEFHLVVSAEKATSNGGISEIPLEQNSHQDI